MLRILRSKACTRCGGSLSLERDEYGAYVECIQCGAVWNEPSVARNRRSVDETRTAESRQPDKVAAEMK